MNNAEALRAALAQALTALCLPCARWNGAQTRIVNDAIEAAHAALAQQPAASGEPVTHVGDSQFEIWFSTYNPAGKGDKQRARDAYAAGMGDPGAAPQPAPARVPHGPIPAQPGPVLLNGALVICEQFDRAPCPHQPHRRCGDCPGLPTTPAQGEPK